MVREDYVLVTAAKNEESYIERTIKSVIVQTRKPKKWIIVSDGSTDKTEEIVRQYQESFSFLRLLSAPHSMNRNFGSKVRAIQAGYEKLVNINYSYLGILDADISFDVDYFERLIEVFRCNRNLGIAGGIIFELIKGAFKKQNISLNSVAGAVQTFRLKCYEDIGGYLPLTYGGIDAAAEIVARSKGWEARTIPELRVFHHRRVVTGSGNLLKAKFHHGITHYRLGYHPLFQIFRCIMRLTSRPYVIGSLFTLTGYLNAWIRKEKRLLPENIVTFLQIEQKRRLRKSLLGNM